MKEKEVLEFVKLLETCNSRGGYTKPQISKIGKTLVENHYFDDFNIPFQESIITNIYQTLRQIYMHLPYKNENNHKKLDYLNYLNTKLSDPFSDYILSRFNFYWEALRELKDICGRYIGSKIKSYKRGDIVALSYGGRPNYVIIVEKEEYIKPGKVSIGGSVVYDCKKTKLITNINLPDIDRNKLRLATRFEKDYYLTKRMQDCGYFYNFETNKLYREVKKDEKDRII